MSGHQPEEVRSHLKFYWMIYFALLALTGLTVGANHLSLSVGLGIGVALIIASVKGSLVAAYFMHLSGEKKMIFASLILTLFFFIVLLVLPALTSLSRVGTGGE